MQKSPSCFGGLCAYLEVIPKALESLLVTGGSPLRFDRSHEGLGPCGDHLQIGGEELVADLIGLALGPWLFLRRGSVHIAV